METVQSANAQFSCVANRKFRTLLEGLLRKSNFYPQSASAVLLKPLFERVCFASRDRFSKNVLFNGVIPLGYVQGR